MFENVLKKVFGSRNTRVINEYSVKVKKSMISRNYMNLNLMTS